MFLALVAGVAPAGAGTLGLEACFREAGARFGVAPELLQAIAAVESGLEPLAQNANGDGSRDIGIMQINSWWLGHLAPHGIRESHLWDPCYNISIGAWILAHNVDLYGYTWDAVGAYHAGTSPSRVATRKRHEYARKVMEHLARAGGGRRLHHAGADGRP